MALENYTGKIADMVVTNPTPTDPKSQGDDHLRGIKYTLQQSFPNFDGPLNAARVPFTPSGNIAANNVQAALQEVDTETQAGLATKVSKSGDTMTGPLIIYQPDNIGLLLRSSSQPVGNNYIQFQNSGGSNTGYIGHGSSANNAIQIVSDDGISLTTGGGHTFKRMDGTVNASVDTVGNFMALGTITPNGSDRRLKDSIAPIAAPLDRLTQITGYDFTWKPESGMAGADTGFIAQEIQTVFPQMITGSAIGKTETEDPGYLGIALGNQITALLVEAVKELSAKLDSAMAEIAALKAAK